MRFVFGIYADDVYREVLLPKIDNTNYEIVLQAKDYDLIEDVLLSLEVVNGQWSFRSSRSYQVFCDGQVFEGHFIRPNQTLQVTTPHAERIFLLVWQSTEELAAYRKYQVEDSCCVTIGRSEENDICYAARNLMGHRHARIYFNEGTAYIQDLSVNGTYLEDHRVQAREELQFGQHIGLYGMSIIYLGNILAVNSLDGSVSVREGHLKELRSMDPDDRTQQQVLQYNAETTVNISPRSIPKLYDEPEIIEGAPTKQEKDKKPAWMSILPSLTMVLPMVVGYSLMQGGMRMGLVISVGSAIVGVTWAIINLRFARKTQREQELLRLERYGNYLIQCADRIREKFDHNRQALLDMYPDTKTCSTYGADNQEIWARRRTQSDFLFVRLGLGDLPFQVKITAPARKFSLTDDELADRPAKIAKNYETIHDAPLGVQLTDYNVVGLLGGENPRNAIELSQVIITQIAANHSYTDVKLAVIYNGKRELAEQWSFVRWLPHVWNEDRTMRYVASNSAEAGDVLYALVQILRTRAEQKSSTLSSNRSQFYPHYVLFVEDPSILAGQPICKYLYESGTALGITTIILADRYESLPSACNFVVEKDAAFHGMYSVKEGGDVHREITFDPISLKALEQMARRLSSLRVNEIENNSDIPDSLTFFDMMKVHTLDEMNVLDHWRKNRTYESLKALVGQRAGGADCYLDIHEKYHGPHGLVAGTTGSGKSETLQTYILSLAINYSPLDVGFFIIDFKGGGMANLFSNLPHMLGQISNLSGNQVRRAMVSIKSENNRRQRLFGEFGVNHIDAYTKLVKNREATVPIPHLLIIIDEFAELKREEPEFMRELISVAQVGRSLGVHLILATQKPSGTVDDNIWSNTRFRLCLRVADRQDSNDMLHRPDAAYLTQAGRCYLQVGNNELYELFQSGWSGAAYDASGTVQQSGAVLLDLQGREALIRSNKRSQKNQAIHTWMCHVVRCICAAQEKMGCEIHEAQENQALRSSLATQTVRLINQEKELYPEGPLNLRRIEDVILAWPMTATEPEEIATQLIDIFRLQKQKLPEAKEETQLEAVVEYLANLAKTYGFQNSQRLWMPVLPDCLFLDELEGYPNAAWRDGSWPRHSGGFQLSVEMGLVDAPENQMQFPLVIDFSKGHLVVVGGVASGKSTFLQTLFYALINCYSPAEVNLYGIDFSSQMLTSFAGDAHVGGIVLEGEDDRLNKLFGMITKILQQRKAQIKGGSFSQYIRLHGWVLPAIVVAIDGYANFKEKTENRFERELIELSREAEGYGIFLVLSCTGFGGADLQNKIADNIRQGICLELADKYRYNEALHISHFDVLPEVNVKGRGLAALDGNVLEYQTALACRAETTMTARSKSRRPAPG